jgi:hypothetical protein
VSAVHHSRQPATASTKPERQATQPPTLLFYLLANVGPPKISSSVVSMPSSTPLLSLSLSLVSISLTCVHFFSPFHVFSQVVQLVPSSVVFRRLPSSSVVFSFSSLIVIDYYIAHLHFLHLSPLFKVVRSVCLHLISFVLHIPSRHSSPFDLF